MEVMLDSGYLSGGDGQYDVDRTPGDHRAGYGHEVDYTLTAAGQEFLAEFGVQIPPKRRLIRYCVDWSEQRHHLSGALGRGLLDRLIELGWVRRSGGSRAVKITEPGQSGLDEAFGISA
jgi:hypothetical protein